MQINKKSVLLCKVPADTSQNVESYEEVLQNNGYICKEISVLDFKYIPEAFHGKESLNPDEYSGIIFTSPRAVLPLKHIIQNSHLPSNSFHIYVVGTSTAKLVERELSLKTIGEECGNANNLADLIIENNKKIPYLKPFLFPCGNIKMNTLPDKLGFENISLEETVVYETVPNPHFEEMFISFTKSGTECPEFIVFFSPSGIRLSLPSFNKLGIEMDKIKFIAIGPTTAKTMHELGIKVSSVAEKPAPLALVDAIKLLEEA